nr:hypothetical protein GCM10017745_49690 [Saccharothrix mutabilis subsp. capreolus]
MAELLELPALACAFAALPPGWRLVLWRVEVEGLTVASLAETFGLPPSTAVALLYRAREGLRIAYLDEVENPSGGPECDDVLPKVDAWRRRRLSEADGLAVGSHLSTCPRCRFVWDALQEVAGTGTRGRAPSRRYRRRHCTYP